MNAAARAGLALVVLLYVGYVSRMTLRIHYGFGTAGFDIGIFDQGVWLLSRLEEPFVTVRGLHLFGDHTSFILLALVPFYWVFPSASALLVAQSLALGAAAVPVFLIARAKLRSEALALACAVAFLAHPAVAWTNFENFHPDSFEVPLVLFAFYFVIKRRWAWFGACIVALLLVKEDVPLLTFVLGLYVAARHHRTVGLVTAGASVLWLAATMSVVIPAFNEAGPLYASRLPGGFEGVGGFFKTLLLQPSEIAAHILGPAKTWYVWQLLAPLAMLSLLAPKVLFVAAGPLLANLLSTFPYQHQLEYHYSTLIVPVLVVSALFGIARWPSLKVRAALALGMLGAALAGAYLWGPMGRDPRAAPDPNSAHARAVRQAIEMIPAEAAVSAKFPYVPHLTHREQIYEFPNPWRAANWGDGSREGERLSAADEIDYVLLDGQTRDDSDLAAVMRRLEAGQFQPIFDAQGVLLLERVGAGEGGR